MVETKKSIRISNIIQRKETKNANNTREENRRNRRVHKETNKNEEDKPTGNGSNGKLQKKSLIVKKTRSQSEEQAKDLTKKVDADSKYLRKDKCIAVICEKPKDIEMGGLEMKKTTKPALEKLNRNENTEETSEKSRDIAEIIQDSGPKQCLENKSNSKKKSSLDRKNIKDKIVEDDEGNIKPVSNKIKNLQVTDEEIDSSQPKKELRGFANEMKYSSKSVESPGYKLKEKTIMENKIVDETEMDLKTDTKDKNWPVNISNSYSKSESEIISKSAEERRINEDFNSDLKGMKDEKTHQPVSRKIMNFKEVVEAILEAKDSDESDNETKIIMTQKSVIGDVSIVGPTSSKNYWNHPTIGIEMATVSQKIPTENADGDKKPLVDVKRESKKMNVERGECPTILKIVEESKSPDIDSKIFPTHVKIWDTKEIPSGNDAQKNTEIEKDRNEKIVEKFTKDEKRQSSESQKSKKVTSGKEKSGNEAKSLAKVMNKKRTRTKSLRKESTEEIEELNNITDKMRKLDTKTTEPFIQDHEISEAKLSVDNKFKHNKSDDKFLISKELAETRNPEIYPLYDETTKKIDFSLKMSDDKIKSGKNETFRKLENVRKEEEQHMNTDKEFILNQKLKEMVEAQKSTEAETVNIREKTEKVDKGLENMNKTAKPQELLMKLTETKITKKAVEKYIQSDQDEQHEQLKQIVETDVNTENKTEMQNVKKSVLDKTAGSTDRTKAKIEDTDTMLEIPIRDKIFIEKMHKDPDGPKKLLTPTKSKKEVAKKDESAYKNEKIADIDHSMPKTSQRPSRKTKEAAAIYMEILSHKLVSESRIDDDNISIDSFPELPNVKKTEQRENELKKAQVKTSRDERTEEKTENTMTIDVQGSSHETINVEDIPDDIKLNDLKHRLQTAGASAKKPVIMSEEKIDENEKVLPKRQSRNLPQTYRAEDSHDSDESFHAQVKVPRQKKLTRSKTASKPTNQDRSAKPARWSSSDESTTSDVNLQVLANRAKSKKLSKTKSIKRTEPDFSESDEEPLSKLTAKSAEGSQETPRKPSPKPKRECARIPQNYLPMFSSSDEEDIFHGFDKKAKPASEVGPRLLDQDLSRRFGKEKVNMSNEQIQQWLKDSALAEEVEKPQTKPEPVRPADRKLIFRKDKRRPATPNVNAFSPENESSVYAFGEEADEAVSTPFRRPSRRPSSTATSRSDDDEGRFRRPGAGGDDGPCRLPPARPPPRAADGAEFRYKVPSSPSAASSSSSARRGAARPAPPGPSSGVVEAPVFRPSEVDFRDPLSYIERVRPLAEPFGVCRVVPPAGFRPECRLHDGMRFTAYDQRVHRMLRRWGPSHRELTAIRRYLATHNIALLHPPLIGGMEIDLPKLYQTVQTLGGLKEVIEKKKWPRVSELMKIPKSAQDRVTKLDDIYCKYLLPYDTLSVAEREKLFDEVETEWAKRESRKLQPKPDTVDDDDSDPDADADECITKGRNMALSAFYRIARNTMSMYFKTSEPTAEEVEQEYWKHVTTGQNHICVHSGSIDSGSCGYGFAVAKNSPFARHPWNLKVLTNNSGSVLRSIAPLMAVTVPTLHVGMVFSACCWHRDPHGLPWIEYLHTGGAKVWYGVPHAAGDRFRAAVQRLAPALCRDAPLWLPADAVMVPPAVLVAHGVPLSRTVQRPGEFVVVFPQAFTSALSTGYTVSESVYFAPARWLRSAPAHFAALRAAREPSMFSLDRLVVGVARDARCGPEAWRQAEPRLRELCEREARGRARLGLVARERLPLPRGGKRARDEGDYECDVCRTSLFVSMIFDTVEGRNYCLDHGIEMLDADKAKLANCKFMFTYDDEELAELQDKLKAAIENRGQKKVPSKFAGMPTLLAK